MISVGFLTLLERKLLRIRQIRKGPNKVFKEGLLQPILDGLKLFKKVDLKNLNIYIILYKIIRFIIFFFSLLLWVSFPFNLVINKTLIVMWIIIILGLASFCILLIGWSSTGKYRFLGSIRRLSQNLRFELNLTAILLLPFVIKNKFNISLTEDYLLRFLFVYYLLLTIILLMEVQRSPIDLAEGERELVRGYNTEYSSIYFTFIFLAEYLVIIFFIILISFLTKMYIVWLFIYRIIIVRACYPRIRYDLLIRFSWFKVTPIVVVLWLFILAIKLLSG